MNIDAKYFLKHIVKFNYYNDITSKDVEGWLDSYANLKIAEDRKVTPRKQRPESWWGYLVMTILACIIVALIWMMNYRN